MDKKVILAVAGSGKTYHICHSIDITKRTLILAFTNENIHNIRNELFDAYGEVPNTITVMTFDSFVYRYIILPFEPTIADHFKIPFFYSKGITTIDPPPKRIKQKDKYIPNPMYIKQDSIGHYMSKQNRYYCNTLSELAVKTKKGKECIPIIGVSGQHDPIDYRFYILDFPGKSNNFEYICHSNIITPDHEDTEYIQTKGLAPKHLTWKFFEKHVIGRYLGWTQGINIFT